ncbi:hypothetical protein Avbf_00245 [Armadillidium vulgare]|nr:hypothetical protein Avbf_00245 [Armadillidium vulgare]
MQGIIILRSLAVTISDETTILRSIFKEVQKFTLFPKSSEYTTITKCLLKVNDSSIREHTEFLKLQCKTIR